MLWGLLVISSGKKGCMIILEKACPKINTEQFFSYMGTNRMKKYKTKQNKSLDLKRRCSSAFRKYNNSSKLHNTQLRCYWCSRFTDEAPKLKKQTNNTFLTSFSKSVVVLAFETRELGPRAGDGNQEPWIKNCLWNEISLSWVWKIIKLPWQTPWRWFPHLPSPLVDQVVFSLKLDITVKLLGAMKKLQCVLKTSSQTKDRQLWSSFYPAWKGVSG